MNQQTPRVPLIVFCPCLLLCIVASLQIYLAFTRSLSPWKGGGFGMFSTVDAPRARFLRIYLVNEKQETPVLVPDEMRMMALEARTFPTDARLSNLAHKVVQGTWVPYRLTSALERYCHLISDGHPACTELLGRNRTKLADSNDAEAIKEFALNNSRYIDLGKINSFRLKGKGEPEPAPGEALEFHSARVELWKYVFDPGSRQLKASKFSEVVVTGRK